MVIPNQTGPNLKRFGYEKDWLRLVEKVQKNGLKAKPEVDIQFGTSGASVAEALEAERTIDPE